MDTLLPLILTIVFMLLSLVSLVIFIMVLIKLFKHGGILLGILGIFCSLFTFVWGWIKHKELNLTKQMLIWTCCWIASIILWFFVVASFFMVGFSQGMGLASQQKAPPSVSQKPIRKTIARTDSAPAGQPAPGGGQALPSAPGQGTPPLTGTPAPGAASGTLAATGPMASGVTPIPGQPVAGKAMDYDLELKNLENLIKFNDKNADNFYNRGCIYQIKGELQLAEKDYTKAIELDPKYENAYYNRGLIFINSQSYDLAIKDFSESIKLKPGLADAYCNRGNVYFQTGKIDLALMDYNEAVKLSPMDGDLYFNQGLAFLKQKDKEKALNAMRTAAGLGHARAKQYLDSAVKQ